MSVECLEFKSCIKGCMLGFINLFVPKMGLEIYGCTLWQKDGRRWINLPSREYKDENGEKKYMPVLRFREKAHYDAFVVAVKDAVDVWCKANPRKEEEVEEPEQSSPYGRSEEIPF